MPNFRKHSASTVRAGSCTSIKATRAARRRVVAATLERKLVLSVVLLNPEENPLSAPYSIVGKGGLNNNAFRAPKGVRKISPESCTDGIRNVLWDKTGTNTGKTGQDQARVVAGAPARAVFKVLGLP
jgi:hypothetical protein